MSSCQNPYIEGAKWRVSDDDYVQSPYLLYGQCDCIGEVRRESLRAAIEYGIGKRYSLVCPEEWLSPLKMARTVKSVNNQSLPTEV